MVIGLLAKTGVSLAVAITVLPFRVIVNVIVGFTVLGVHAADASNETVSVAKFIEIVTELRGVVGISDVKMILVKFVQSIHHQTARQSRIRQLLRSNTDPEKTILFELRHKIATRTLCP
ncbi:hypothetical protein SATMO3_35810 [Sporomusa aerivorans]